MRAFNADTVAQLETGRIAKRDMLLFTFPSGSYGFWSGQGPLEYNGVTYIGAQQLIKLEALGSAAGMAALAITATLTSIPNTELTPNVLATIENEDWHQTPVVISKGYFNPDTRELISVERMFRGYFDKLDHITQTGDEYTLTAYFESKARDYQKIGYRMRGDADQRLINATDNSLQYAAVVSQQTISWGRIDATASTNAGGSSAFPL